MLAEEYFMIRYRIGVVFMTIAASCATAYAVADQPGFTDYDIAIQELNKVKKKYPKKERKPHKTEQHRKGKTAPEAAQSKGTAVTESAGAQATGSAPSEQHQAPAMPVVAEHPAGEPTLGITHDPFSFLVAGKRSTVQAVIETGGSTAEVLCRFRADNSSSWGRVPMSLVSGTHFTYRAVLPAPAQSASLVQYQFVVVDREGKETLSREFGIPVRSSLVVPGWQFDPSGNKLPLALEKGTDLLEGFSDPGVPVALP